MYSYILLPFTDNKKCPVCVFNFHFIEFLLLFNLLLFYLFIFHT